MAKSAKNREVRLKKTIKKGYRRSPNLDNLKSNTMKNTHANIEIIYDTRKFFLAKDLAVQFN